MDLLTDRPGLQVYTGTAFDGSRRSTTGRPYRPGGGVALEAQLFPDTPNRPDFGSAVLRPGETWRSSIEWRFGPLS
jgi:aldose 1-epimerase